MEATEPMTIDSAVNAIMEQDDNPAPETTEVEQSEVSDTEEVEAEALASEDDDDTTEVDTDEEAETDEADADEAEEEDADEDEAEDDAEAEPDLITVKVDGTEQAVTLDELKRSYSGQAKIQKDFVENANTRKQLEQAAMSLMEQQNAVLQMRQQVEQQGFQPMPQPPDNSLIDKDPQAYLRQRAQYEADVSAYQQEQQQLAQLQRQRDAYAAAKQAQIDAQKFEKLKETIPEFADEKTGREFAQRLVDTGTQHYKFSVEEMGAIDDERALWVLRDAMRWRELEAKQATSKAPPKTSRNVKSKAASKAAPDAKAKAAKARFGKTRSINDAIEAIFSADNP